jgi:type II secretory pathway predicted ATPase ExeA
VFSRVTSWQVLSNLPANEALAMISFRCQTAGRDAPLFTDSGFLKLYHSTQGVPRQIVSICSDLLHLLARDGKNTADAAEVDEAIARYQLRDGDGRAKRK